MSAALKLSPVQVGEIVARYGGGESCAVIGRSYGVTGATVRSALMKAGVVLRAANPVRPSEIEVAICARYADGENTFDLAAAFGLSLQTVCNVLERGGIARRRSAPVAELSEEEKVAVCGQFEAGNKCDKIAARFGVRLGLVYSVLTERGFYPERSANHCRRKHSCNHAFFAEIAQPKQAYVLGFVAADGNVHRDFIKIDLQAKDSHILSDIAAAMGSTHPVKVAEKRNKAVFCVYSPELAFGLRQHGITPAKSFSLEWPGFLPVDLASHYLRGYIDGDGCWDVRKRHIKPQLRLSILGSQAWVLGCQEFLAGVLGVTGSVRRHSRSEIYTLTYASNQAQRIARFVYPKNADLFLGRKFEKVAPFICERN